MLTQPIRLRNLAAARALAATARTDARRRRRRVGRRPKGAQPAADGELTGEFWLAHDEDMGLLRDALREQRFEGVARAAHRIKGAARMYGDGALADAAAKLEEAAHAGAWPATENAPTSFNGKTNRLSDPPACSPKSPRP